MFLLRLMNKYYMHENSKTGYIDMRGCQRPLRQSNLTNNCLNYTGLKFEKKPQLIQAYLGPSQTR